MIYKIKITFNDNRTHFYFTDHPILQKETISFQTLTGLIFHFKNNEYKEVEIYAIR